ncbi:lysophospholipid acyltransferase family protein [Halanaerobaculum tunisiense]
MKEQVEYYLLQVFKWLINFLPAKVGDYLAIGLGNLLFYLIKGRRELGIKNIKSALDCTDQEAYQLTKEVFVDIALKLGEVLRLENWTAADFKERIKVEGLEHLQQAYDQEQGIVLFTGHFGNWELLGLYLSWLGYPVNAVAREHGNDYLTKEIWRIRESQGASVFNRQQVKAAFKKLIQQELLLLLGDQDAHQGGCFVEFFQQLASTPKGPVVLAQKAEGLILPVYLVREELGNYRLFIEEPVEVAPEADETQRKEVLQQLTTSLEEKIRAYPAQWLWLHRRWKTDPKEGQA